MGCVDPSSEDPDVKPDGGDLDWTHRPGESRGGGMHTTRGVGTHSEGSLMHRRPGQRGAQCRAVRGSRGRSGGGTLGCLRRRVVEQFDAGHEDGRWTHE